LLDGEDVSNESAIRGQGLGVGHFDVLGGSGGDGEDSNPIKILLDPLNQSGVFGAADDVLVDLAGLLLGKDFGSGHDPIDAQGKVGDLGPSRDRKIEVSFKLAVIGVIEGLADLCGGEGADQGHIHAALGWFHGGRDRFPGKHDAEAVGLTGDERQKSG
jgi:hypothetical protein